MNPTVRATTPPRGAAHIMREHPTAVALMAVLTFIAFTAGLMVATITEKPEPRYVPAAGVCQNYADNVAAAMKREDYGRANYLTVEGTEVGCFHTN